MSSEKECDDFNNKLFEKVNELHSGNIYTDSQTGKIVVINYEGIRDLAKSLLEDKKLSSFYELGITKALETYVKTNPRLFEDLTLTDDIYYETNFMKHVEEKPSIFGKACNYLVNTVRNHRNASIGIVGGSITGLVGIPFLEKYLFHNDTFVKASESDNTIGIYSNNIDWELNKSTILQTAQETGVQIYRITDPEEFSNYDKILVLGGHKAYTDKYMPINIAKYFLNDEEKEKLLEEYNILFKVIDNPYGKNPDQKLIIFAGSDRDCTVAVPLEDNDRDRLENIKEVLAGTNPLDEPLNKIKNPDYDGDGMGDRFEYGKKLYDPSIPNDRYFININTMQFRESVFDEFLIQTFDFNPDNIYSFMGNDATFYNFKKSVEKIKREADNNDIIYISLIGHGFENGFSFSGQEGITYEEIDKLLDKINAKCIFVAVNACYEKTSLKPLSEGNGYRLVVAYPVFNKYFDLVYKQNMNPSDISVGDVLDYAKVKSDSFEDKSKIRYHLYLGDKRSDKE